MFLSRILNPIKTPYKHKSPEPKRADQRRLPPRIGRSGSAPKRTEQSPPVTEGCRNRFPWSRRPCWGSSSPACPSIAPASPEWKGPNTRTRASQTRGGRRAHPKRRRGTQGTCPLWRGRPWGSRGTSHLPLEKISKRCKEHTARSP